MLITQVGEL